MRGAARRLLALAGLALALLAGPAVAAERVVNVYNWSDYIDPRVLDDFTKETGIRVVYDTYDSNEMLEAKLLAGGGGYDLVVPSGTFLQRGIKAGLYAPLDKAKLPNLKHAWPEVAARLSVHDPGNAHAVTYLWGTTGIGYNAAKVRERLGTSLPDGWALALRPETLARLKDCGVHVLDAPEDGFASMFAFLGLPPDTKDPKDFTRAADAWLRLRPSVRKFHSSEYISALASGEICLAVGYSGDLLQARRRAREARNGVEIAYLIPREGALMTFDALAIPSDAPHKDEAHALIDYLNRPEVAARNVAAVAYASGNLAARALIPREIAEDPAIYPPPEVMARLFVATPPEGALQRVVTRQWTRVTTGR